MYYPFLGLYTCTVALGKHFCWPSSSLQREARGSLQWTQAGCIGKDCKVLSQVMAISLLFSSVQNPKYSWLAKYYLDNEEPMCFTTLCSLNLCYIIDALYSIYALYITSIEATTGIFLLWSPAAEKCDSHNCPTGYITIWYFSSDSVLRNPHHLQRLPHISRQKQYWFRGSRALYLWLEHSVFLKPSNLSSASEIWA